MKKIITSVILTVVVISCNEAGGGKSVDKLENSDQKASYAYGVNVGEQVARYSESLKEDSLNWNEVEKGIYDFLKADKKSRDSYATGQSIGMSIANFVKQQKLDGKIDENIVVQGILNVVKKDSLLFPKDSVGPFMQKYIQDNVTRLQNENLEKGNKFLESKKKDSKVKATESGLLYEVIKEGEGTLPNENSIVEVNYVGKLADGKVFDESKKGEPAKFPLKNVIPGWKEGLQLMKIGSKYKFYIPANLGYGQYGSPDGGIGPNEVLEFEVELVSAEDAPAPSQQPSQPQLSPEDMKKLQEQMQKQQQGR